MLEEANKMFYFFLQSLIVHYSESIDYDRTLLETEILSLIMIHICKIIIL